MRVLVTGAFGNIGAETLRELLAAGHSVRAFDLDSKGARSVAREFASRIECLFGDVTNPRDVAAAVAGCDAVIHDAAILPPRSERNPAAARRVNVDGTLHVIEACEALARRPRLVFASSISLYGPSAGRLPPVRAEDPIDPTDVYTESKARAEELVGKSDLDWVVLRFAAAPPEKPSGESFGLEHFFSIDPDTRLEYLHPSDAGLAQARAISCAEASRRVLLIGGGPSCQVTLGALNDAFLGAVGLGAFPREAFGTTSFYTDWMDTRESQRLLGYQRHGFDSFEHALRRRNRWLRLGVRPLRAPLRWWMLRKSVALRRSHS